MFNSFDMGASGIMVAVLAIALIGAIIFLPNENKSKRKDKDKDYADKESE